MSVTRKWPGLFYDKGGAVFNVKHPDFGAVGDGVTDDTAALQAAINAAIDSASTRWGKAAVFLPEGDYKITSRLLIEDVKGFRMMGVGVKSRIIWEGTYAASNASVALCLFNVSDSLFERFRIHTSGDGTNPKLYAGVWSETKGGFSGVLNTTANVWRQVTMEGTLNGIAYGWRFDNSTYGQDVNNDLNIFDASGIVNFTQAGWYFGHSQSKQHHFLNRSGANASASSGLYGVHLKHGSFHWVNCGCGNVKGADFYIENMAGGDAVCINGHESELSARLLDYVNVNGAGHSLTFRNVRFDPQTVLHADGYAVRWGKAGNITFEDCTFGGDMSGTAGSGRSARMLLGSSGIVTIAAIKRCGFSRDLRSDPDYNTPIDFFGLSGSRLHIEDCSWGNHESTPQDLNTLRNGVTFVRAFPGGTFYTANTAATSIDTVFHGIKGQVIQLQAGDANTTLVHNGTGAANSIWLTGGANLTLANGQAVQLVFNGTYWRQL